MPTLDEYLEKVIKQGDEGSKLLRAITSPTMKNSEYVEVLEEGMNGMAVLRVPEDYYVVVHSASGDPEKKDLAEHTASLVDKLVEQSEELGATPVAFSDIVDSNTGENDMLTTIGETLRDKANQYKLAIMNGENAVLGSRINPEIQANVSGTMISLIKKDDWEKRKKEFSENELTVPSLFNYENTDYAIFDPKGKPVVINSDGVGTKTEFYERIAKYWAAINDFLAMNLDDTIKSGAIAQAVSGVIEIRGSITFSEIERYVKKIGKDIGILCAMQHEPVGDRLVGYRAAADSYNISGSVVSVIDEERLKNPPKPSEGEYLVAIAGDPNPRSNGITDKRKIARKLFGENYHYTKLGRLFLEFLAEPSTILYPTFKLLIERGIATSVYHMSGGAYNGKLAKPLAKHDLYIKLENLFNPDWRELAIGGASFTSAETAYAKWPMGNDGFITTKDPDAAIKWIKECGLKAKVVGKLEKAVDGKTGVELTAFNGQTIYYSGKD